MSLFSGGIINYSSCVLFLFFFVYTRAVIIYNSDQNLSHSLDTCSLAFLVEFCSGTKGTGITLKLSFSLKKSFGCCILDELG